MSLNLTDIQSSAHSIEIKNAAGQAIAIDGSGYLTSNINGTVAVTQSGSWDIGTVTAVTDITNVVSVDDNGSSLTVDGTVAATQSGSWDIGTVTTLTGITNDVSIDDGGNTITVDGTVAATQSGSWSIESVPGGYASWKVTKETVPSASELELVSTPLSGRLSILIQNLSSNDIYVKEATGVSTANGMLIAKKNVYEADLDDGANIFAIGDAGATNDVRVVEYAA